ncbi:unnamed protein product [Caenorhabditis bovis]|uniref:Secreted protein n=1 Tax=Caenorhabditis bovis TaxID=2654633 RepID=A0A8S1EKW4_9PELO|nr:unnamed protein product [Caenorhabditis bovis]
MLLFVLLLASSQIANCLICHQCEGWRGSKISSKENSCLRYNNNCETNVFCVKITEPMTKQSTYEPYKSECWHQNNLIKHLLRKDGHTVFATLMITVTRRRLSLVF